jgi:hypothetical protein
MSNDLPPLSPLNRMVFVLYYLPLVLAALVLLCSLPLVFVVGLFSLDAACEFLQGCNNVLLERIECMKAARIRLARKDAA